MPTVEDYFDDDTDLPLPSASSSSKPRPLQGSGLRGALLEEVTSEDEAESSLDYDRLAEQNRGIFGEASTGAPPVSAEDKGKMTARPDPGELRPGGGGGAGGGGGPMLPGPNTPMGGFMGDMMKLQQAEEERVERMRKQFGSARLAGDPSVYKGWNTVYPLYFDAKVSINDGRRVPRTSALWWPQAVQISQACRSLGLPSVLEPDKVHPADWENPGRVKVQFEKDGKPVNPIVKNRTQLYKHLADQMRQQNPSLVFTPTSKSTTTQNTSAPTTTSSKLNKAASKSKTSKSKQPSSSTLQRLRLPSRPPRPPNPVPPLEERFPLHSPAIATGVAVSAIKRDIETEKENKKKGLPGAGMGAIAGGEDGEKKEKLPKMKRMVVRGKR